MSIRVEWSDYGWRAGVAIFVAGRRQAVVVYVKKQKRLGLRLKGKAVVALKKWLRR